MTKSRSLTKEQLNDLLERGISSPISRMAKAQVGENRYLHVYDGPLFAHLLEIGLRKDCIEKQ